MGTTRYGPYGFPEPTGPLNGARRWRITFLHIDADGAPHKTNPAPCIAEAVIAADLARPIVDHLRDYPAIAPWLETQWRGRIDLNRKVGNIVLGHEPGIAGCLLLSFEEL